MTDERWRRYALLLTAAAAAGWLFDLLRVPVGWLLGPMLVGVATAALRGAPERLPVYWQAAGQAVLGLSSGLSFPLNSLKMIGVYLVPLFFAVVITVAFSLLNGYLLWRWARVDKATGFMGSLPGAASSMVAMSDGVGADAVTVALLQYLRMMVVVFVVPVAVHWLFPTGGGSAAAPDLGTGAGVDPGAAASGAAVFPIVNLLVLSILGIVGAWGGRAVRLPSPTFLGPFLAAVLVSWFSPWQPYRPAWVFAGGLLLVGLSIGARFDISTARRLGRVALFSTGLVVALIGLCLVTGYLFHVVTGVDTLTAVLGSTPGGMEVMVASSVALGGDAGLVVAMQMARWFMILLIGPWAAARLLNRPVQ